MLLDYIHDNKQTTKDFYENEVDLISEEEMEEFLARCKVKRRGRRFTSRSLGGE